MTNKHIRNFFVYAKSYLAKLDKSHGVDPFMELNTDSIALYIEKRVKGGYILCIDEHPSDDSMDPIKLTLEPGDNIDNKLNEVTR